MGEVGSAGVVVPRPRRPRVDDASIICERENAIEEERAEAAHAGGRDRQRERGEVEVTKERASENERVSRDSRGNQSLPGEPCAPGQSGGSGRE